MKLTQAKEGQEYVIDSIDINDADLNSFLFTLGCYSGESITLIKRRKSGCIIVIKDGRYSIDSRLADTITVRA